MINLVDKCNEKEKVEDLINDYNLLIYDEKDWIWNELWKIAELTYSYNEETKVNTTLFEKWWWLDLEKYKKVDKDTKKELLINSKERLEKLIQNKKNSITEAIKKIEELDLLSEETINTDLKDIFINSIKEKYDFLEYCEYSLIFELEKAWIKINITEQEEKEIEEKLSFLDKKLFWWNIKDHPEEAILAYEVIFEKFTKNKDNLTSKQLERFNYYLWKIKEILPENYIYNKKHKPKEIDDDFLETDIPKTDYILWFNILVESLEKLEHIVESNISAKSISDWPKWVQFPTSDKFSNIKMLRFFKLWNHEIETHNITDYNSRQLLWNLRWANSTKKDEWLAMLMEQLFIYWKELFIIDENWNKIIDKQKIQINSYFTKTLMWELLNNEEFFEFLELSELIDPDVIPPIDRFFRLKRNNKKSVQHKDTTYTRWLFEAIDNINKYITTKGKKWIKPEDLFLWKISFEETKKLKNIKERKQKDKENNCWKLDIIHPLFISDAVYFIISKKLKDEKVKISSAWFLEHLKEKYPIFDFKKEQIDNISLKTKKNIYWIVNIMMKNIKEQELDKIVRTREQYNKTILNIISNKYNSKIELVRNKMIEERKNAK